MGMGMLIRKAAVKKAVMLAGGQTKLAGRFKIAPQSVQQWVATGRIPAVRVIGVEAATDGRVSRHELRPDIYPAEAA